MWAFTRLFLVTVAPLALTGCTALPLLSSGEPPPAPQVVAVERRLPPPALVVTPEVREELRRFLEEQPLFVAVSLERREAHAPTLTRLFEQEGVPAELINVAMIESGFKVNARSHAGAVGMWQFMPRTARSYGLTVHRKQDDRKDVIRSTRAAARHLRDLYLRYGCWYLSLAAYNAGVGSVNRAMNRAGSNDFWTIARDGHLRRETERYVPRFIAATLLARQLAGATDFERVQFEQLARNLSSPTATLGAG